MSRTPFRVVVASNRRRRSARLDDPRQRPRHAATGQRSIYLQSQKPARITINDAEDPRSSQVRAGNQKGRVERAIRYVRDSFWAGRVFTTLAECNRQALLWHDQVAHQRRWPGGDHRTVADVFAEEQSRLLSPA
jgi:hypothetical protein